MSIDAKRRYAAAAFSTLLLLSVFWPSPVVSANRLWFGADLDIDELSFLGRESPSWDVVFWGLAGILLIAIVQSAEGRDTREPLRQLRRFRMRRELWLRLALMVVAGALLTAIVWIALDAAVLAWAEGTKTEWIADSIRIVNRFGGGMNPVMIVAFFLVAGIAYAEPRWVGHAIGMAIAGLAAGLTAQIVKHLVGRARPELWLGPSHYAPGSSTSFPSGHTVGAFALAGILVFSARSRTLRVVAFLLAAAVGLSRIYAFRHWASDVTASAVIGLAVAWTVARGLRSHPEPQSAEGSSVHQRDSTPQSR
jgi:membrane-associated phospholipid phosphatase